MFACACIYVYMNEVNTYDSTWMLHLKNVNTCVHVCLRRTFHLTTSSHVHMCFSSIYVIHVPSIYANTCVRVPLLFMAPCVLFMAPCVHNAAIYISACALEAYVPLLEAYSIRLHEMRTLYVYISSHVSMYMLALHIDVYRCRLYVSM